jgi:hypothetical protein
MDKFTKLQNVYDRTTDLLKQAHVAVVRSVNKDVVLTCFEIG